MAHLNITENPCGLWMSPGTPTSFWLSHSDLMHNTEGAPRPAARTTLPSPRQPLCPCRPQTASPPAVPGLGRPEPAAHRTPTPRTFRWCCKSMHLCLSSLFFLNCLPLTGSCQALNKNVKGKTIKRLEENVGKYLCDLGQGRIP